MASKAFDSTFWSDKDGNRWHKDNLTGDIRLLFKHGSPEHIASQARIEGMIVVLENELDIQKSDDLTDDQTL